MDQYQRSYGNPAQHHPAPKSLNQLLELPSSSQLHAFPRRLDFFLQLVLQSWRMSCTYRKAHEEQSREARKALALSALELSEVMGKRSTKDVMPQFQAWVSWHFEELIGVDWLGLACLVGWLVAQFLGFIWCLFDVWLGELDGGCYRVPWIRLDISLHSR